MLFARGQSKGSTLGHAAFLMKFILKLLRAEICYTCIYLDFIVICPQKIIIFLFLQIKISKLLLINIFVRGTHGN